MNREQFVGWGRRTPQVLEHPSPVMCQHASHERLERKRDVSDRSRNRVNRSCSPAPLVRTRPAISASSVALLREVSSGPRGPDYGCDFSRKPQLYVLSVLKSGVDLECDGSTLRVTRACFKPEAAGPRIFEFTLNQVVTLAF